MEIYMNIMSLTAVELGKKIKAKEQILLYLPNDYDKNEIKINYNGIEKLNYGMKKDTKIGYIDISYKNKIYKKVDVVLDEDVNFSLINFIKNNIITISIFIIILLFTLLFFIFFILVISLY